VSLVLLYQFDHAIVFIVPRHQHGREKAKDKGLHQSKANPSVLHRDLDTDGALSSQNSWHTQIVNTRYHDPMDPMDKRACRKSRY